MTLARKLPKIFLSASLLTLVTACAVGPDFERPAKPSVAGFDSDLLPAGTEAAKDGAGTPQTFKPGDDIPAEWWQLFHSEPLNTLVTQSLKLNPTIAAQQGALRAASENVMAADSAFLPTIQGAYGVNRQKISGASFGGDFPSTIYTLHNATVSASYALDVFGGIRRQVEELEAQEEYARFELEAAKVSLTANVVTAAIQEASLRGQIEATKVIIDQETRQRDVLQRQLDLGGISKIAVLAQEATLAQFSANLPPLEKQLSAVRHQLSVLGGQFPSDAPNATFTLDSLTLPAELPVSLPSNLVEQRPDIRAAEATLHAESAAIGVAESNRLPQITLSADIGTEATEISKLFSPGGGIWSIAFNSTQVLFDAGQLAHEQGFAEAEYDVAVAQYKQTVLTAFQDVADALRAVQTDAVFLNTEVIAEHAAAESLQLSQDQFNAGSLSYLSLLDAEHTEQQAKLALVQAEAQRFADTAALFQALGGGWWNQAPDSTVEKVKADESSPLKYLENP